MTVLKIQPNVLGQKHTYITWVMLKCCQSLALHHGLLTSSRWFWHTFLWQNRACMIHLLDKSTTMGKSMEPCSDLKSTIMVSTSQECHLEPFQMDKEISFWGKFLCSHETQLFGYSEQACVWRREGLNGIKPNISITACIFSPFLSYFTVFICGKIKTWYQKHQKEKYCNNKQAKSRGHNNQSILTDATF